MSREIDLDTATAYTVERELIILGENKAKMDGEVFGMQGVQEALHLGMGCVSLAPGPSFPQKIEEHLYIV
jgi:hypothetical protein